MSLFTQYGRTLLLAVILLVVESAHVSYSAEPTGLSGSGTLTDKRDGQKYKTVKIDGKTWMAQNLNYQTGKSWCCGNGNSKCSEYGRLYDWKTAKTACPSGWRLPSSQEWNNLVRVAGGEMAGRALKSLTGWEDDYSEDKYGFSALPGGRYEKSDVDDGCRDVTSVGVWWTGDEMGEYDVAYSRIMDSNYDNVQSGHGAVALFTGYSVRCIQK